MKQLTVKQFKAGYQQFETFYCDSFGAVRYSYAIAYYHYCNKYFVNFGDHASMKYIEQSFDTAQQAYLFLEVLLKQNNLKSKY